MFQIRSIMVAQGGRRDEAVAAIKEMNAAAVEELGVPTSRVLTGSIGPTDSTVVMETQVEALADFEAYIGKINGWAGMAKYGPKFGELFVDGSHRFEVYRICD